MTPFNLGGNITPEQVNYDGNYPYADGKKGKYRKTTVEVGKLNNANGWGLCDMHGNVHLGNFILTKFQKQDWLLATGQTLTQDDVPLGFIEYMSPEQIDCAVEVDVRSDIWSLGVLGYYLASGRLPFTGKTFRAIAHAIYKQPVPESTIDCDRLQRVLQKCLQKDAGQRYANVRELLLDL